MADPVLKVERERWHQAQVWELQTWRKQASPIRAAIKSFLRGKPLSIGDDWNFWWAAQFDAYRAIPDRLENAVELGCGPYTNIRLILQGRQIKHVYCSDPLAREYVTLGRNWLARAWRSRAVLIDDHPIEECPFASGYFDLVVLINVLDHVRDAVLCLEEAVRITKERGYLIIGQDLTDEEDAARIGQDIGHPIRLTHATLDSMLTAQFDAKVRKILSREEGRNPRAHYGTCLFIGQKTKPGQNPDRL